MATHPGQFRGISRGIFGLSSWDPVRQPGQAPAGRGMGRGAPASLAQSTSSSGYESQQESSLMPQASSNSPQQNTPAKSSKLPKKLAPLVAKFSYKANPDSPLGKELAVTQKDKLIFISCHPKNDAWWVAENSEGEQGYVPASYMMVIEVNGLPWLQNQEPEPEPEPQGQGGQYGVPPKGVCKPYQSAYGSAAPSAAPKRDYKCHLCSKTLNGPQPYSAHMHSKAHKEEMEIAREEGWLNTVPGFEDC